MIVHLPSLSLGLLLLWFPRAWLRLGAVLGKRRRRQTNPSDSVEPWKERLPGDPRLFFSDEFLKLRNYVDLGRALAGGLALCGGFGITAALELPPEPSSGDLPKQLAVRAFILLVGVLIQTTRYEHRHVTFYPPIFYLAGLSASLSDPRGAIFAFALIWAVNGAIPNAQAFLTAYAILLGGFGYFFGANRMLVILIAGLCFLPVLLSLLANRPLVVLSRKGTHRHAL